MKINSDIEKFCLDIGLSAMNTNYWVFKAGNSKKFQQFRIKKKNGEERIITASCSSLLNIQRTFKLYLEDLYKPISCVHGFVSNRSIITNATSHVGKRFVINIDLEAFFPSITFSRILGLLSARPYSINREVSTLIANSTCCNGKLIQGSPLSPIISNMMCKTLDRQLISFAKNNDFFYSRYADDITFSTNKQNLSSLVDTLDDRFMPSKDINQIIESKGFKICNTKFHVQNRKCKQIVTGLIVNKKINIDKRYYKEVKAIVYDAQKDVESATEKYFNKYFYKYPKIAEQDNSKLFRKIVRGKLEFIKMIKGSRDRRVISLFKGYFKAFYPAMKEFFYPKFALSAIDIVKYSTFVIESEGYADIQGTGFLIQDGYLITCYHVYDDIKKEADCSFKFIAYNYSMPDTKYSIKYITGSEVNSYDLAIFKIDFGYDIISNFLELSDSVASHGSPIIAVGYAGGHVLGQDVSVQYGQVDSFHNRQGIQKLIISSTVHEGMSGGPLLLENKKNDENIDKELKIIGHLVKRTNVAMKEDKTYIYEANDSIDFLKNLLKDLKKN